MLVELSEEARRQIALNQRIVYGIERDIPELADAVCTVVDARVDEDAREVLSAVTDKLAENGIRDYGLRGVFRFPPTKREAMEDLIRLWLSDVLKRAASGGNTGGKSN